MKQAEYIETIVYNDKLIVLGLDDYGQTYFIEYVEDGKLKEECIGSYNADYEDYIEWRFGNPEVNCSIYCDVITNDTECCMRQDRAFCGKCRKAYNDVEWTELQKRRENLKKYFEEEEGND